MALFRNRTANRAFCITVSTVGVAILILFFIAPLSYRWFPSLLRNNIFQPNVEIPDNLDYEHPESFGFYAARNFYLTTSDGVKLGIWHILPANLEQEARNINLSNLDNEAASQYYTDWMSDSTVFIYMHGSAGTRTSPHRLRVYSLLSQLNYHVIAFDYRGYGDSSGVPLTESDVVEDARTVFYWVRDRVAGGDIIFWGHSLGTGVASSSGDALEHKIINANTGRQIDGIVLEAPFNNVADGARMVKTAKLVSFLPWFEYCFIQPLYKYDLAFESDKHLQHISTPVIILAAKDDNVVPFTLAEKLYEDVAKARKDSRSVRLVSYDASLGYGHYNIPKDPNLNETIRQFVDWVIEKSLSSTPTS